MNLEVISKIPESEQVPGEDVIAIIFNNDKLLTAINTSIRTGIVKNSVQVWSKDLQLLFKLEAHEHPIFDMTNGQGSQFYTSCSDSTINHWEDDNGHFALVDILRGPEEPAWKLRFSDNILYSGHPSGQIRMWENGENVACLGTVEEIWDMLIENGILYTTRHLDVYLTTIGSPRAGNDRMSNWSIRNTIPGSGPLLICGQMLVCLARQSYKISVHHIQDMGNPLMATLVGHEAIVTSLVSDSRFLFSGGYDKKVISWDLNTSNKMGEIQLEGYITSMTMDLKSKIIYVAGENQFICSIQLSQIT